LRQGRSRCNRGFREISVGQIDRHEDGFEHLAPSLSLAKPSIDQAVGDAA
jgi:hypothetical protein